MITEKTWWASFDPETFKYAGMRLSVEQPENATNIGIGDLINPVWNPALNQWEGESSAEQTAKLQAAVSKSPENESDTANLAIASLTKTVADLKSTTDASISALMLQVAQLQPTDKLSESNGGN